MNKQISIVILSYNSSNDIAQCLNSIKDNNDIGDALEVTVVDNNSADVEQLKHEVDSTGMNVKLILSDKNGGYGYGNNLGIRESTGRVLMIFNPDARLHQPVFSKIVDRFSDEKLAILGMEQYEPDLRTRHSFMPRRMNFPNLLRYRFDKAFNRFDPKRYLVHGACVIIRRSVMEQIGLFDENLFLYGEELDVQTRVLKAGYKIMLDSSIGYVHPMRNREFVTEYNNLGLESQKYLCRKYGWPESEAVSDAISTLKAEQFKSLLRHFKFDKGVSKQIEMLKSQL